MTLKSLVKRRLDELAQSRKDTLVTGAAKDMAEYGRLVGFIEAISLAYNAIEGLLEDEETDEIGR